MKSRWALLLAGFLIAVRPALAAEQSLLEDRTLGKEPYARCLELSKSSPGTAIDLANGWYKDGGGAAALHCEALALVELKRYAEAAGKLDEASKVGAIGAPGERAALQDQAGNAWLLGGKADKADAAFSAALAFAPQDEDILADRARARGLKKDWTGADADLSAVLSLDPNRADALVLRASARHAEGRRDEARDDIERALEVDPDYPEALLERGTMKFEAGDAAGARADWTRVVAGAPGTDAAAAARLRLQSLTAKPAKP